MDSELRAFKYFKNILELPTNEEKYRAWLQDYKGLHFSIGEGGKDLIFWQKEKEKYVLNDTTITTPTECFDGKYRMPNKCQRHKRRLVIEFDDNDLSKIPKHIVEKKEFLKSMGAGYIESTHGGKSNYIWVEFSRDLTSEEAERFLGYFITNRHDKIDLNFASDNKRFPILFAPHWKYGTVESVVEYHEGEQIDYDSLKIPKNLKVKKKTQITNEGFEYETSLSERQSQKILFNFDSQESNVKNIIELEKIITQNFPDIWFETRACTSLFAAMSLKNLNGCPSLNLVGAPSGEKTTILSFFYNHDISYLSDDFTPKSFVSHSANIKSKDLDKIDLLPRIRNKVLISPELAPLFEAPKDELLSNFSMLTRVLDGEGLNRDSGTHGHRGYSGDYKFGWLGATTPVRASVWNLMGKIGNRLFFLNMLEKSRTEQDLLTMMRDKAYEKKIIICRGAMKSFLDEHFRKFPVRSLEWDAEQDIFVLQEIIKYAQILAKLRGTLMLWKAEGEDYQFSFPIIEEPPRAINALFNFAKGHALINGRTFLQKEDLEIVRAIAFSSMPYDRTQFLKLLLKHEGRLTTQNIQHELNCSDETARKTMKSFDILKVVTLKNLDITDGATGRPLYFVEIRPEFLELFQQTHPLKTLEKSFPSEIHYERVPKRQENESITTLKDIKEVRI